MQAVTSSKSTREPLVGGVILVFIGIALLLAQVLPQFGQYIVLVIGIGLLTVFAMTRAYGALVAGSIVTGVGAGVAVATSTTGDMSGAAVVLFLGAGFLGIWIVSYLLRLAERHWWPLIPGLILGSIGVALAVGDTTRNLVSLWPIALVALGVILIVQALFVGRRDTV